MNKCVIISGGEFESLEDISGADFIVACDKGYFYACKRNIVPSLIVGDFDSYDGMVDESLPVLRFQKEKDDTDTMIAVKYAIQHGFGEVQIRCGLGGRLDHTIANIQAGAYAVKYGLRASVIGRDTEIHILNNSSMTIPKKEGCCISLLSHSDICEGVSISGVKYPLNDAVLTNAFPLGISNEWIDDEAIVKCNRGILIIIINCNYLFVKNNCNE